MSITQRLNTSILGESELVSAYDSLGLVLWSKYFIESQGYSVEYKYYQDNQSNMLLGKSTGLQLKID